MTTNPTDYLDQITRITCDGVYFGGEKLPGLIAEGGITLKPGSKHDINTLTVEFLVGPVMIDDATVEQTKLETPATTVTQLSTRRDRTAATPDAATHDPR